MGATIISPFKLQTYTLFFDADCGFCRWSVRKLLAWDRQGRLHPVPLQDPDADRLLGGMDHERRFASWHLVTPEGLIYSAGAAIPVLLRLLPGWRPVAVLAAALPGPTEWAYQLVVRNRHHLTRVTRTEACQVGEHPSTKADGAHGAEGPGSS